MKNLGFIAVMALLMMFGCSKDEMITSEQNSINSKSIVGEGFANGQKGPNSIVFTRLDVTSDIDSDFLDNSYSIKILKEGLISGKVRGFGPINKDESYFIFENFSYVGPCEDDGEFCNKYYLPTTGVIILEHGGKILFTMDTYVYNYISSYSTSSKFLGSGLLDGGTGKFDGRTGTISWDSNLKFDEDSGAIISTTGYLNPRLEFRFF